ncbi:hypothetical protein GGR58DRAFT_521919 [Xylaria digitata]|nr:hypothetical protein GGR58DRAFT_521919 [Xylaria digitata]
MAKTIPYHLLQKALDGKLSIPVVVDNPNVGENLQDHPDVCISFEVADGVKTLDDISRQEPGVIAAAMEEYTAKKSGPFVVGGNFAGSLLPVPNFADAPRDEATLEEAMNMAIDTIPGPFSPITLDFNFIPKEAGADILQTPSTEGNFLTICAALLYPLSRGSVHINSTDPADKPIIDPRYLEHPLDLEVLARYLRFIDQIIQTEALSQCLKANGRRSTALQLI